MSTTAEAKTTRRPRLRWWHEVLYSAAFYLVYSTIRNWGVATDSAHVAFVHAKEIIRIERLLGIYHEESVQTLFLGWHWFIKFWDVYYGSFHFIVTAVALVWCFRKMPDRYPVVRNTLAITTALALIGFAFFPLMPPRLLPAHYGFVDTLQRIGGLWSFDSGTMKSISNQYAAMPSLHFAWSSWSAMTLWPLTRDRPWAKILLLAYPAATLFAIVVTANHYVVDAAAGLATLAVGYVLGSALTAWGERWRGVARASV